ILLIPVFSILFPFPGTKSVPGIGVCVAALGLMERDGVLVILGLLIGVCWAVLFIFLGYEMVQFLKDWLTATF
ncbi:MAG: exopolysaccharide biosynthesis protein, partial [Parvularculaceae bacterium]